MVGDSWSMALHLTREMVRLAHSQEWEAVAEREAQRSQLLESLPQLDAQQPSSVVDAMQEIVRLDKELVGLCQQAQAEVATALGSIASGRRINDAYTKNL